MPYTGVLILVFIIYHLLNFHFVDKSSTSIFAIVSGFFTDPVQVGLYIAAVIVVAVHVSHGFWSLFQTFGANHSKYMPAVMVLGILFSIAMGVGFGFIPVYVSMM